MLSKYVHSHAVTALGLLSHIVFRVNFPKQPRTLVQHALAGSYIIDTSTRRSCEKLSCVYMQNLILSPLFFSAPETFGIVTSTVDISSRKNLDQISKVLTQVTTGVEFGDDNPSYIPINDFVQKAIKQVTQWLLEGTPDAPSSFGRARCNVQNSGRRSGCGNTISCTRISRCHGSAEAHLHISE